VSATPLPIDQFAAKVRAKYPGAYDHLSDQEIVQRVVTKYPQYKEHIASYAPTQFEKERGVGAEDEDNDRGFFGQARGALSDIVKGAFTPPEHPIRRALLAGYGPIPEMTIDAFIRGTADLPRDLNTLPYRVSRAVSAYSPVPVDPGRMEEASEHADPAGVMGAAVVPAAMATAPLVGEGAVEGGRAVGRFAGRHPEATGAVGGAAVGTPMGHPFLGAYFGRLAAKLMEADEPEAYQPFRPLGRNVAMDRPPEGGGTRGGGSAGAGGSSASAAASRADVARAAARRLAQRTAEGEEGIPTSVARQTGRMIATPSEARAEEAMGKLAKRKASERGMAFAGGQVPAEGRTVPRLPTRVMEEEWRGTKARPRTLKEIIEEGEGDENENEE